MNSKKQRGALALAMALGMAQAFAATPQQHAPDVVADPKGAWEHFLANGEFAKVYAVMPDLISKVGFAEGGVEAAKCREQAQVVRDAVAVAPVSVMFRRIAMLCAEATGDAATAEREMKAVAALARHALAGVSDSTNAAPIRVVGYTDIGALLDTAGLEARYAYYRRPMVARDYPYVVAVWDPDKKVERHLAFDFTDTAVRLAREPNSQYPAYRSRLVATYLEADEKFGDVQAIDIQAVRRAFIAGGIADKVADLRMGTEAGGLRSPRSWILACSDEKAPADCADGLADALLPLAEKQHAFPMTLLAYAYGEGVGVPGDRAAATKLLDAADQRWSRMGASVAYADLWMDAHEAPLPEWLVARLARAEAGNNENAAFFRIVDQSRRDGTAALSQQDIAYLSRPSQNGHGEGLEWLAIDAGERKDDAAERRWLALAAEAGSPYAQSLMGSNLLNGDGVAYDAAAGRAWLVKAAHGGNNWSARRLHYIVWQEGDAAAAEQWLLAPIMAYDGEAILALANLYSANPHGVSGDSKRAVELYRSLTDDGFPDARRRLALMLASGTGTAKDTKEARRLLLQDAEAGDHESEGMLGLFLLRGELGKVEEREGRKWVQRALDGGEKSVSSDYGFWLFYTKDTAASRQEGLAVWRKGLAAEDYGVANNLSWALCTTEHEDARDGKAGLDVARKIGADLDLAEKDTMAACHAAAGDFATAQTLQREVVDAYEKAMKARFAARGDKAETEADKADRDQLEEFQERLQLYADGKPYVEIRTKQ